MMQTLLPFKAPKVQHNHVGGVLQCPLFQTLPSSLQSQCKNQKHLLDYLHWVPMEEIGIPNYCDKPTQDMKQLSDPNIIYQSGDNLFVHIYSDRQDIRNYYISIEPSFGMTSEDLLEAIDDRLLEFVHEFEEVETLEERREILLRCIDRILSVRENGDTKHGKYFSTWRRIFDGTKKESINVPHQEYDAIRYRVLRDKSGLGPLDPLIRDEHIEDISCSGVGNLFIEHKIFGSLKANIYFDSFEQLDRFVVRISERIGRPVTFKQPVVDATLPDGSRINMVYGSDVSRRGSNFTIRKFGNMPMSVLDLIAVNTLSYEMAAYLSLVIGSGLNVFVSGETASGKTTLLNGLTAFIPPNHKIVSIEDTPELQVPHPNWIQEVIRGEPLRNSESNVDMFTLLKAALRQRPNNILVGEIRGSEGNIAFQAMQSGHACMATFHASSVEKLIQRLTGHPIDVPKVYIDNLDVVVVMSSVTLPDGRQVRRVISVNEIVGYEPTSGAFSFLEIFKWNSSRDLFEFTGRESSYVLENKVALRRGLSNERRSAVYKELEKRARIFNSLHRRGATKFYEFYAILAQIYRKGIIT